MRTSVRNKAGGWPPVRGAGGFTLIELMVTLVIMGLLAGLASMSIGGNAHRQARDEADRLFKLLGYVSDEAAMQGEEYGVLVEDDRYSVLRFDSETETWAEAGERHLAPHPLPGTVRIELQLDEPVRLASGTGSGADEGLRPEVLVLSSGEISAFDIAFRAGDADEPAARLRSDGSGSLQQD
jgi:general secretion pathway protein H